MSHELNNKTVCVAGLGYVGLPLALAFSRHLKTIGFDVDAGLNGRFLFHKQCVRMRRVKIDADIQ